MVLLYPFLAVASLLVGVLTMLLAPLLALTTRSDGNLPRCLYWFQTFDATLDDCRKPPFNWTGPLWWTRTCWLWRNPAYGFDMFVFGCSFKAADWHVIEDTPARFIAVSKWGAFSYRGTYFKWGWKAWARLSGVPNWTQYDCVPIVVLH